jgi:hypothetical protein
LASLDVQGPMERGRCFEARNVDALGPAHGAWVGKRHSCHDRSVGLLKNRGAITLHCSWPCEVRRCQVLAGVLPLRPNGFRGLT